MEYKSFLLETKNKIAYLSFNRPEKANAVDATAWKEMKEIFEKLDKDPNVRVVLLCGNGKNFCSGIDLSLLMDIQKFRQAKGEARQRLLFRDFLLSLQESINAIEKCRKPVISAIQGACIGAGVDIITACDIRFCSENAYFSIKEIDMGLVADLGTLQRLPKLIPYAICAEMAYTGRDVQGKEAEKIGLVNKCLPDEESLYDHAGQIASNIASKSPLVIQGIKNNLQYAREHSIQEGLNYIAAWNTGLIFSNDIMEAFAAKMAKRNAEFEDL